MENFNLFWTIPKDKLLANLSSSKNGLTWAESRKRVNENLSGKQKYRPWHSDFILLISQFKSPLVLLLLFAIILSVILGEYSDGGIILCVLLVTGNLGFFQERNAGNAVRKLQQFMNSRATVKRDGREVEVSIDEVVPGDILVLNAGDIVAADGVVLEENDLHVNESALTGESFPVEKNAGDCNSNEVARATNAVFKGTSVVNGTALVLAVNTGEKTELGKITTSLAGAATISSFEKGISKFGYHLIRLTIIFTGLIFILNILFQRAFLESVLFSLALTVGLTPELLPAILTITLASGAKRMAAKKVIVKKLNAIQNLGEIDVLCSDKTGTITTGIAELTGTIDVNGAKSSKVMLYAFLNASFESGFSNPIDESIRKQKGILVDSYQKADEVPYDFIRKRLSIVVSEAGRHIMITKGAVKNIFEVCSQVETGASQIEDLQGYRLVLENRFEELSNKGFRVIGICYKDVTEDPVINKEDEQEMIFLGFLIFSDPLKENIADSISHLKEKGIRLKIITGDNRLVARHVGQEIGLGATNFLTGLELLNLTPDALMRKVEEVDVFAEILPVQKEQIIKALQASGHAVGYLGDGINDANALKAADVGISINNAVDVAREAADIVLLDQNLPVILAGVEEGRKTFMNTMKYIMVTTSANFGNMFSMALASLFLPFLPLLPVQILLNNFLSDLPAIAIASDNVDSEMTGSPKRWKIKSIWRFMILFGLQSSLFDFAVFGWLYFQFKTSIQEFRTAWFMESLLTEVLVLLVIRTQKPFFRSRPSSYLLWATVLTFLICIIIPYLPFASIFQFTPLPFNIFSGIIIIVVLYILVAELSKRYLARNLWQKV